MSVISYTEVNVSFTSELLKGKISMIQGDTARGIIVKISDDIFTDGTTTASSMTATLVVTKPSGLTVTLSADSAVEKYTNATAYKATFSNTDTIANIIAERGTVECQLKLTDGTGTITSFSFELNVIAPVENIAQILSTSSCDTLEQLKTKYEDTYEDMVEALDSFGAKTTTVYYGTSAPASTLGEDGDIYIRVAES